VTPRRRWRTSGRVLFAALAAAGLGVPAGVSLIDTEADDPGRFSIILWVGWVLCAVLGAVVLIHAMSKVISAPSAGLALAYDALPILLVGAWIVVAPALITRHWLLGGVAGSLCLYHLHLITPRFRAVPTPRWVEGAPTFRLCVANVYVDNPTPDEAARAVIDTDAEVLILVESTPAFMRHFDSAPGADRYRFRVADPGDTSDYAVTIASRIELAEGSGPEHHGELRVMRAVVPIESPGGRTTVTIFGINPMATVDVGGYRTWRSQLRRLRRTLAGVRGPLVIAGDLNTSRFRPEFAGLLDLGLRDVHDTLGKGLQPSFKLSNRGWLSALGPVARLDHALTNRPLHPIEIEDLEAHGSDHLPFVVTIAVHAGSQGPAAPQPGTAPPGTEPPDSEPPQDRPLSHAGGPR